jgi:hypothetical protein
MDLQSLVNYVTMVAAAATVVGTQILKSSLVPVQFQKYPVPTAAVVSLIATYVALLSQHFVFALDNWAKALGTFVTVFLVAALTYNHIVKPAQQ